MKTQQKLLIILALLILAAIFHPTPEIHAEEPDIPSFDAYIAYSPQGYIVKGTLTQFTADISQIQPLFSLDGKNYHICGVEWDLGSSNSEDPDKPANLRDRLCLYHSQEPLKNYLDGEIDRFYLKLRLTYKDGTTLETKTSVIDRGTLQPLPENVHLIATFASCMSARKTRPFLRYGKYQITVSADMTPQEILAFLPDKLPIEVQLQKGIDHFAEAIVECPVTWKQLSLPKLTAGESITISDAAEEILVPAGTLLKTPMGIFQLEDTLGIHEQGLSDEIELVLNVASEEGNPTGALTMENAGLELSFDKKPTGATDIRVYTLTENETKWSERKNVPLLKAINVQPSTPNSGYTLVLKIDEEPLRSYLAAAAAEDTPVPFFIGLKIEGGVYDGRQLILSWPANYDLPLQLPKLEGSGGNENNAGAENKEDGTPEGQRPTLPQSTKKPAESTKKPAESTEKPAVNTKKPAENTKEPTENTKKITDNTTVTPSDWKYAHVDQSDQKTGGDKPGNVNLVTPPPFFIKIIRHSTTDEHPKISFPTLHAENTALQTVTRKETGTGNTSDSPADSPAGSKQKQHITSNTKPTITTGSDTTDSQAADSHTAGNHTADSDTTGSQAVDSLSTVVWFVGLCLIGICLFALVRRKSRSTRHKKEDKTTTT